VKASSFLLQKALKGSASAKTATTQTAPDAACHIRINSLQGALCGPGRRAGVRRGRAAFHHVPRRAQHALRRVQARHGGMPPKQAWTLERARSLRPNTDGADRAGCRTNQQSMDTEARAMWIRSCVRVARRCRVLCGDGAPGQGAGQQESLSRVPIEQTPGKCCCVLANSNYLGSARPMNCLARLS